MNLIKADNQDQSLMENVRQHDMLKIRSASDRKLAESGTIIVYLCMCELCIAVTFGVVDKLAVKVLLRTSFTDRPTKSHQPTKMKLVRHHSPLASFLIVHEVEAAAESEKSNNRQEFNEYLALFVSTIRGNQKNITVAEQIYLKLMCETPVLVSIKRAGLLQVPLHDNVTEAHACVTGKSIVEVYSGRSVYITIGSAGMAEAHRVSPEKVSEVTNAREEIEHMKDKRFSCLSAAQANNSDSSVNAVCYEPASHGIGQTAEQRAVKTTGDEILIKNQREDVQLPIKFKQISLSFLDMLTELRSMLNGHFWRINASKSCILHSMPKRGRFILPRIRQDSRYEPLH